MDPQIPSPGQDIDILIRHMLQHDPRRRATTRQVLASLFRIIKAANPSKEILDMVEKTPVQRGIADKVPHCLLQYEDKNHVIDIGYRAAHRMDCADVPREAEGYFRCGACIMCNTCCKCMVKRHGKMTKEYFRMSTCE
mmetsp:Transcript_27125/g.50840  ORF Transcript_27125/g.50840 Transcript_27125/m.50840 type:complete len:138 (+) Transcript_27125:3-416(+)